MDGRYGNLWFEQTGLVKQFLAPPNGIPPDTFRRVFERINPKVFALLSEMGTVNRNTWGTSNSY